MKEVLNICAYRFVALVDTVGWQRRVREQAGAAALKGTVLIAEEGINLVLAGAEPALREFLAWLVGQPPFRDLPIKESWSATVPFGKLRVRIKSEIIRMNRPTVRPAAGRAPAVDAQTLARWLDAGVDDAGRAVVLLDTRNGFEVDHGRFRGAHDWRLARFSDFPAALDAHRHTLRGKTVVSYCTGGIRCEKAALWMHGAGVSNAYQLDGGILKYFETVGDRHFQGNCFVFDERGTLNDTLLPVGTV